MAGSDSSMDDCNISRADRGMYIKGVQIPLWTIVTGSACPRKQGSAFVQIPLWTIVTSNLQAGWGRHIPVQIPLWTIVT